MAQWKVAAEGTSFADLEMKIADIELVKGARVRIVMDTLPFTSWVFDLAGVENVFKPVVPEGMDLVDVWGEGGKGYVEMEADPAWLAAVVLGLPVWAWLAIGGVGGLILLGTIITFIVVMIKVPGAVALPVGLIVGAAIAIVGLTLLAARSPPRRAT